MPVELRNRGFRNIEIQRTGRSARSNVRNVQMKIEEVWNIHSFPQTQARNSRTDKPRRSSTVSLGVSTVKSSSQAREAQASSQEHARVEA